MKLTFVVGLKGKPERIYIAKRVGLGLDEVAIAAGKEGRTVRRCGKRLNFRLLFSCGITGLLAWPTARHCWHRRPPCDWVMTRLVGETCGREPGAFDPGEWRGYRFSNFKRNQRNDDFARAEYGLQVAISSSEARGRCGPP